MRTIGDSDGSSSGGRSAAIGVLGGGCGLIAGASLSGPGRDASSTSKLGTQLEVAARLGVAAEKNSDWSPLVGYGMATSIVMLAIGLVWSRRLADRINAYNSSEDRIAANRKKDQAEATTSCDRPFQQAPRTLLQNPYSSSFESLDFSARVQLAIEGSLREGRVVSVIHFIVPPLGNLLKNGQPATAQEIAALLMKNIRPSDGIFIKDAGNVFVFLSLILNREDTDSIRSRLANVLFGSEFPATSQARNPGWAMYPMDGYHAEDLMDSAQARSAQRSSQLPDFSQGPNRRVVHAVDHGPRFGSTVHRSKPVPLLSHLKKNVIPFRS